MNSRQQISSEQMEALIHQAQEAYKNAYVPYSHYPVGAATLWESGRIVAGSNIENASYGLTCCAERNSVFQSAHLGERRLMAVAVAVPTEAFPSPCGACRQVLREFSQDCMVILVNGKGQTKLTSLSTLLPDSFGPGFLG